MASDENQLKKLRQTFVPTNPFITGLIIVFGFIVLPIFAYYPWVFGKTAGDAIYKHDKVFKGLFYFELVAHSVETLAGVGLLVYMKTGPVTSAKWIVSMFINGGFSLQHLYPIFKRYRALQKDSQYK